MQNALQKLSTALLFLLAVALSIKNFREPDLWWQIRTGEWILENLRVPDKDVFSYTFNGADWVNVKWGFEVLAALVTRVAGPESVFIIQALVTVGIVWVLLLFARKAGYALHALPAVITVTITLLLAEYRINGRPEMFSHLLTLVFLYLLLYYRHTSGKILYVLVPLQVWWANMHEAFGIGLVLVAVFTAGDWLTWVLQRNKLLDGAPQQPMRISALLALVTVAVCINPRGVTLLTRPLQLLGQVYENKYTIELFDFTTPEYWTYVPYSVLAFSLIGLAGAVMQERSVKSKAPLWKRLLQYWNISYLLVLLAFVYLATTAYRNVVFFLLVAYPLVLCGCGWCWQLLQKRWNNQLVTLAGSCMLLAVLYVLVVSNSWYRFTNSRDRFGLQVSAAYNPTGAAAFVKQKNLSGACFSDYLTSSYLLWKLSPGFKTFIDLRDLDVFPASFFNTFAEAVTFPEKFQLLDSIYHFNYVVLYRPQFTNLHRYLSHSANYRLAYLDAVAAVYTRDTIAPAGEVYHLPETPTPGLVASFINKALNVFYSNDAATGSYNWYVQPASYYLSVGNVPQAFVYARQALTQTAELHLAQEIMAECYYNQSQQMPIPATSDSLLALALQHYEAALRYKDDFSTAWLGVGAVYFKRQNYAAALENFEQAFTHDPLNLNAWLFAAECCKFFINARSAEAEGYTARAITYYSKADKINPDNPTILLNLGLLYYRQGDCAKAAGYLQPIKDFPGIAADDRKNLNEVLQRCAGQ